MDRFSLFGPRTRTLPLLLLLALAAQACSVRKMAIRKLGDALASGGTTFSSDEDPELVGAALPFSLKLIESLLAEAPDHQGLLFAACSGFTQYTFAFVQQQADETEERDVAAALALRVRARRLYLRACRYGLRGLDLKHRGFEEQLRKDPKTAVQQARKQDVPLLYWTAAAWGSAIGLGKDSPDLISNLPIVEALIDRALQLEESYDSGAIHSFLVTYEGVRQGVPGDPAERSRKHFERAMQLSQGMQAGPLVSMAEAVALSKQDRRQFEDLLKKALAVNTDSRPEWRLVNLVMQRRARWLLSRIDELILPEKQEGL